LPIVADFAAVYACDHLTTEGPLGALPEPSPSHFDWALSSRDRVWTDKLASLADRAARAQRDATRDIPWESVAGLRPDVERGVAQVMTYIAQNEYAAYYVPALFVHAPVAAQRLVLAARLRREHANAPSTLSRR
jgi:hypothetical protein